MVRLDKRKKEKMKGNRKRRNISLFGCKFYLNLAFSEVGPDPGCSHASPSAK